MWGRLTSAAPSAVNVKSGLWCLYDAINRHRVFLIAAGVAFFALLALFPAIAALVTLYGLFADPAILQQHLSLFHGLLPSEALDLVRSQIQRIIAQGRGTLGLVFFTTVAISLWSAMAGIKALFDALNIVYGDDETRSFLRCNGEAFLFLLGIMAFAILSLIAVIIVPVVLSLVGLGNQADWLLGFLRWPALYLILTGLLAALYRLGPSRNRMPWRSVITGSVFAAFLWLLTSMLFSWYVAHLANYNATYGSLGTVIAFMTWVWLSSTIVLIGAEISAQIECSRAIRHIPPDSSAAAPLLYLDDLENPGQGG
jgi:membrane protein